MKKHKPLRRQYTACFYRGNRLLFVTAMLAISLIGLVNLVIAWLMQQMLDAASGSGGRFTPLQLLGMVAGVIAAIVMAEGLSCLSRPRFLQRAMTQYKAYAFEKLTRKSIAAFRRENTATYLSAFTNDLSVIETGYLDQIFDLLFNGILTAGALVLMLYYSPLLTAAAVMLSLLPVGAALFTGDRLEKAEQTVSARNEGFVASLKDALAGFPVIKGFGAEQAVRNIFEAAVDALEKAKRNKRTLATALGILGASAAVSAQFGTLLVGLFLIAAGYELTPGTLVLFADLVGHVIRPITDLPEQLARQKAARGLMDKLAEGLETNLREEGEAVPAVLEQGIFLRDVSFGYEDGQTVLHQLNTRFEAGQSYAVVGPSGSGKSTLLELLMAGHGDYTGEILYDGHEVRTVRSSALYDLVTLMQQNVFVFNDTVQNNITLFGSFTEEEIGEAIRLSGLQLLLEKQGADHLCGENGNNLSGGEKQRIAIARCLLRKNPVLLMDEATAALDRETARHISQAILELQGMTRIVVTHALDEAVLKQYDRILVMKNGRIAEEGTFAELIERKNAFYALYTVAQ